MSISDENATGTYSEKSLDEFLNREEPPGENKADDAEIEALREKVIEELKGVYDPEIPVNIYDLGLIYEVRITHDFYVDIIMTLTTPGCPVAQTFPTTIENVVKMVPGVAGAVVEVVWDPPWTQDRMSEAAKLELGFL